MRSEDQNGGLFFSAEQLQLARARRDQEPIQSAAALFARQLENPLSRAYLAALRYLFDDDNESAAIATALLREADMAIQICDDRAGCKRILGWLSVAAMLRALPSWQVTCDSLQAVVAKVRDTEESPDPLDQIWQGCLQLAAGIVLDNETLRELGADRYRRAVEEIIHPEGFLKGIVDVPDKKDTYDAQVSGTCALVLMAEMAEQVGMALWSSDNRGVTPVTATVYSLYYYFYPEKWKWNDGLTRQQAGAAMRNGGAFIEIVNRRHPLRAVDHLFEEMRPFFDPLTGGLTTLTHGTAAPKKRRWRLL